MSSAQKAVTDIIALLATVQKAEPQGLTPRQEQGLKGAEACILLASNPARLDLEELQTLARAGLIFGAVLAGER